MRVNNERVLKMCFTAFDMTSNQFSDFQLKNGYDAKVSFWCGIQFFSPIYQNVIIKDIAAICNGWFRFRRKFSSQSAVGREFEEGSQLELLFDFTESTILLYTRNLAVQSIAILVTYPELCNLIHRLHKSACSTDHESAPLFYRNRRKKYANLISAYNTARPLIPFVYGHKM